MSNEIEDKLKEQRKRLLDLPCVNGHFDGWTLRFTSRAFLAQAAFELSPIDAFRLATIQQLDDIIEAFSDKLSVIDEIESGRNRYRVDGARLVLLEKPEKRIDRMAIESIAESLYETYCKAVGGKAYDGSPLPSWTEFRSDPKKAKQADAWILTALQARRLHGV